MVCRLSQLGGSVVLIVLMANLSEAQSEHLGAWTSPIDIQTRAIHAMMLKDGKIVVLNRSTPGTGEEFEAFQAAAVAPSSISDYTTLSVLLIFTGLPNELFCAGHATFADGAPYFWGGHAEPNVGQNCFTRIANWQQDTSNWNFSTYQQTMNEGRWYPTVVILPTGEAFVAMGTKADTDTHNKKPEIWALGTPGSPGFVSWRSGVDMPMTPFYPFIFLNPMVPSTALTGPELYFLGRDVANLGDDGRLNLVTLDWPPGGGYGRASGVPILKLDYPSMTRVDDVAVTSGGAPNGTGDAVKSAAYLDFAAASPEWKQAGSDMQQKRKNHTLVALPTGDVVAFGGHLKGNANHQGQDDQDQAVANTTPEVWNPGTPTISWKLLAGPPSTPTDERIRRGYHGTEFILPDARVWVGGGDPRGADNRDNVRPQQKVQIFSPPYGASRTGTRHRDGPASTAGRPR